MKGRIGVAAHGLFSTDKGAYEYKYRYDVFHGNKWGHVCIGGYGVQISELGPK